MRPGVDVEARLQLPSRELRVREDDRAVAAARPVSQRRRRRSRGRNHSGWAMNEMSWIVTASGTPIPSGAV